MKTFEERYTAWIDGKLEGPALTSFELELSRRASAGEARADKEDAGRLHNLLATHLRAPTMANGEFFSHQLRERIEAERASGRRREEARQARPWLFSWPFARVAGLGAACLFVATALYYGTMPPRTAAPKADVAVNTPAPRADVALTAPSPVPEVPTDRQPSRGLSGAQLVLAPTPPQVDLGTEIQVVKVPAAPSNTTATPLQYKDSNVLWINGLDYMPSVPGESPASAAPAPNGSNKP